MKRFVLTPKARSGFTIVELLIVIVIIGILAGIVLSVYLGIQDRAYDIKRTAAIDGYVKALNIYKIQEGTYPGTVGTTYCLGEQQNYPALTPLLSGQCRGIVLSGSTLDTPTIILTSDDVAAPLKTVIDNLPDASYPLAKMPYADYGIDEVAYYNRGLTYTFDGTSAKVNYLTDGSNATCPHGGELVTSDDPSIRGASCEVALP